MTNSKQKWKAFCSCKRSVFSLIFLSLMAFLSLTAPFWASNNPILLFYEGRLYFPTMIHYHPQDIQLKNHTRLTIDYKNLPLSSSDWALWPMIRWSPYESNLNVPQYPSPPSSENWMGTDSIGRDILTRIIYGFRYSMGFAVLVWLGSFLIGSLMGMLMGFWGGWLDLWGQRLVEVFQSLPVLLILITLISMLGAHLAALVLYSIFFGWMNISLYTRTEFLKLRTMGFVQSARAYGVRPWNMMRRHILPNALAPLITLSPFKIAQAIYSLALLDYLGFGLPPPTPSWGNLLQQAEEYFNIGWWLAFFPSLFLFLCLISLNFIGEGVRKAFDPKAA